MVQEKLRGTGRAHSMMAMDEEGLRWNSELFCSHSRPLGKRQKFGPRNAGDRIFFGLTHVDKARRIGARQPKARFRDGDFRDGHARQLLIETGVPTLTFSKNFCAMNPGIRMQPCEAG